MMPTATAVETSRGWSTRSMRAMVSARPPGAPAPDSSGRRAEASGASRVEAAEADADRGFGAEEGEDGVLCRAGGASGADRGFGSEGEDGVRCGVMAGLLV